MRLLGLGEIERLLSNDPRIRERVMLHSYRVAAGGWDQLKNAESDDLPIPVRGLVTSDIWLGPVVIFPKANGGLLYVYPEGAPEAQSLENEIQRLTYVSPDQGLLSMLQDMENRFVNLGSQLAGAAVALGLIVGVVWLLK